MDELQPNTPVIIGVGFEQEKNDNPSECAEPIELMIRAVRDAAGDAGAPGLLAQLDSISVPQGLWHYRNPGMMIAEALGCPGATSVIADLGVLQLTLVSDLCRAIVAGEQQVGVVTGGEAKFRELRGKIIGEETPETVQEEDVPRPEVHLTSSDDFCTDLEAARGLGSPVEFFAIIESALRHHQGLSVEKHRDKVAALYASFSETAAENPRAWRREAVSADQIRNASAKNPLLAFPYTKLHCSQWNVNQSVAILICSVGKARELGLDEGKWVFPLAAVQSKHVVLLAQQKQLHSHPGTVLSGERVMDLAGISPDDITAAELYSCFPSAIQSFAQDLRLPEGCPLSITGAMPFSGGPFNHFSLDGVARMVEVLREQKESSSKRPVGVVTNLSGIFGKQSCAYFSTEASDGGYSYDDLSETVARVDLPIAVDDGYVGRAAIAGYTVVFNKQGVSHAIAICDTPGGERTVARCEDQALVQRMTEEEFGARDVKVAEDGSFTLSF